MNAATKSPCDEAWIRSVRSESLCARGSEKWVLAATIIGSSMAFIDGTVVNLALPVLQEDFAAPVAGMQWIVESYALLLAALLLPGGALGDRHGRRRIFGAGIIIFTLASIACGFAGGVGALIAARAVQGVGAALLIPTSLAIIGASFPAETRGRAIGTWSACTAITMALGPVLGGWMVEHLSWRWVFFINVPLGAAVLSILRAHVPESRRAGPPAPIDWAGMLLVAVGLGAVVYGLLASSELTIRHPAVLGTIGAGVALLAGFIAVEARGRAPMMPLGLFRSRAFAGVNTLTALLYGALYGGLFFFPFNLQQAQGYSATGAGLALLPFSILMFLLSRWSGTLVDRFGPRLPLVVGPAVAGVGFLLFALPGVGGSYWSTFFPAVAVLGLGMTITVTPLTATVLASAGEGNTGVASGVNNAVSRVAGLLAIAILGVVMVHVFGGSLETRLSARGTDAATAHLLVAERAHLASLEPPATMDEVERTAVREAVRDSFVDGFRTVMLIAALLAAASALVGYISLGGRRINGPRRVP